MVREKEAKIASIALLITISVLSLIPIDISNWGIVCGGGLERRAIYPFLHGNLLHAILNGWCLVSLAFLYDIKLRWILYAYAIAVFYPEFLLTTTPTVGLSGVCFFLIGRVALSVRKKLYYQAWVLSILAIGAFMPKSATTMHIYMYICGLIVALINHPFIRCRSKE